MYHFSDYLVKDAKSIPTAAHFAGVVIETKQEWNQGYSDRGGGYYEDVTTTSYYALPTKELLSKWVTEVHQGKKNFFFFEVKQLGSLEVKVEVGV